MDQARTVIVGGGIAGMCASIGLAEVGVPSLLLERNGHSLGGRVAAYPDTSFEYLGRKWTFTLEHGIHGWWRQYRNFLDLVERHGLSGRMIDAFDQTVFFLDGRDVFATNVGRETQITPMAEPLHHAHLVFKKNIRRLIRPQEIPAMWTLGMKVLESVMFDPWDPAHRERYDNMAITDYQRGVPFFYQAFVRSLSRSGFFSDPGEVSLWAYLVALQLYVFLRRSDQRFAFTRGPIVRELFDPMLQEAARIGSRTVRGVRVRKLERVPSGGWRITWTRDDPVIAPSADDFSGEGGVLEADRVVLAVDVEGGKELLASSPDLAPALGDLSVFRGRRATTVRLWFARSPEERWGDSGVYSGKAISDNYFWLHRFQDEFVRFHLETGGSVLESHLYAPEWKHGLSDAVTIERTKRDVESGFPEVAGSLVHGVVIRNRATHINFPVGCARSFPTVRTPYSDLALCGDWIDGGTPVLYMERACQTGLAAANVLRSHLGLPERPLLVPTPPPPHVVGLQRALRTLDRVRPSFWPTQPGMGAVDDGPRADPEG